jgi:uncharacterized protein YlxP (DUF503 family)
MSKLIFERFPISLSDVDSIDYFRFEEILENLVEFSKEQKKKKQQPIDPTLRKDI